MNTTREIIGAFHAEDNHLICRDCYAHLEENYPFITPDEPYFEVDTEAYPDGFTCDGCLAVVLPSNYKKENNQ